MARTDYPSADAYIAAQPEASRPVLETARRAIREALPDAVEVISYQIIAYKLPGGTALFLAGWTSHYSVYPATAPLQAAFREELAAYEVGKGTIRFPLSEPVPTELIGRLARFRGDETIALAKAKAAAKKAKAAAKRA